MDRVLIYADKIPLHGVNELWEAKSAMDTVMNIKVDKLGCRLQMHYHQGIIELLDFNRDRKVYNP